MTNLVKKLQPRVWRSQHTHDRYENERTEDVALDRCPLCAASTIKSFNHWRIIDNKYPWDAVAATHHMILPIEHVTEERLTEEAKQELFTLKQTVLNETYDHITEALPSNKSIPGHHHIHLMVPKIVD